MAESSTPADHSRPASDTSSTPGVDREDARLAYEVAVNLWIYEGTLIWSKYNAMLVANSVILAAIGLTINSPDLAMVITKGLPSVGLLLCVLWVQLTKRGFDYYTYWILSARELEERYFSGVVSTVSRGGSFAGGQPVTINVDGKAIRLRLSRASRVLKAAWGSYAVICVFAILYVAFLLA